MGDFTKGELGTYTVTPETAQRFNLTEGDELVFLPTNVDEGGTASGLAFTTEGFFPVTIPVPEPEPVTDPNAKPAGVSTADWQDYQDYKSHRNDPPVTTNPAPDAPAPDAPTASPFTFTTGGGTTNTDTGTSQGDGTSQNGDTK